MIEIGDGRCVGLSGYEGVRIEVPTEEEQRLKTATNPGEGSKWQYFTS